VGELVVTRNDKDERMVLDDKTVDYIWVRREAFPENSIYRQFAASTKCLAYSINYDISMTNATKGDGTKEKCLILNRADPRSTNLFYPFSRRFYHRSENQLDTVLYQLMYELAVFNKYPDNATQAQQAIKARFPTSNKHIARFRDQINPPPPVDKAAYLVAKHKKFDLAFRWDPKNKTYLGPDGRIRLLGPGPKKPTGGPDNNAGGGNGMIIERPPPVNPGKNPITG
jgi:hypothetical protein